MNEKELKYRRRSLILFVLLIVSVVGFYFKGVYMDSEAKKEMKEIGKIVKDLKKDNTELNKNIQEITKNIEIVDENINKIEGKKIIIKEIYHEKINSVNNYSDAQLDSFFTSRYGYIKN